jgi:predicted AAA+ superfamily ATPase
LLMMQRISDSLAGRALYLTMWPLTRRERLGLGTSGIWSAFFTTPPTQWRELVEDQVTPRGIWRDEIWLGGFPRPAYQLREHADRMLWFSGYVNTYLERDLQDLAAIDNLIDFRRLMQAVCLRSGSLMNQTELGRDTQLPKTTVHRYLNLLETSYQVVRLPAYTVNPTTRLIKTPKLYWNDVALSLSLSGETEPRGAHLENVVLSDLVAWRDSIVPRPQLMYWRMANTGAEIDFVIEHGRTLLPIEVKSTTNPGPQDAETLELFRQQYGAKAPGGLLLYSGERTFWIRPGILAAPWWKVL